METERIIQKLVEHDERFQVLEERVSLLPTKDELLGKLDHVVTVLERLDTERHFTFERVKQLEDDVHMIKQHLKVL